MPEVATDETVIRRRAARAATTGQAEEALPLEEVAVTETALRTTTTRPTRPVIRARAVYLGGDPSRSVALSGRVMSEPVEWKEAKDGTRTACRWLKKIADSGTTSYTFASRNSANEPILERLIPVTHAVPEVRGRVFDWVEHPDHAYALVNLRGEGGRPEFQIVGDAPTMALLEEYFMRKNRSKRDKKKDYDEISS